MNNIYIKEKLDHIIDSMPIAREIVEIKANSKNIDYIDYFVSKTISLENIALDFKKKLKTNTLNSNNNILDDIHKFLYILEEYCDFINTTADFLKSKKNNER